MQSQTEKRCLIRWNKLVINCSEMISKLLNWLIITGLQLLQLLNKYSSGKKRGTLCTIKFLRSLEILILSIKPKTIFSLWCPVLTIFSKKSTNKTNRKSWKRPKSNSRLLSSWALKSSKKLGKIWIKVNKYKLNLKARKTPNSKQPKTYQLRTLNPHKNKHLYHKRTYNPRRKIFWSKVR